jgi:hypothetical protein
MVVSEEVLCSVVDGQYTESDNCSVLMKKKGDTHWLRMSHIGGKGRHVLAMRVLHRKQGIPYI